MIILVLNQGLKSTRCIAFDFNGNCIAESSKPINTSISEKFIEQDPSVVGEIDVRGYFECYF